MNVPTVRLRQAHIDRSEDGSASLLTTLIGIPIVLIFTIIMLALCVTAIVKPPLQRFLDQSTQDLAANGVVIEPGQQKGFLTRMEDTINGSILYEDAQAACNVRRYDPFTGESIQLPLTEDGATQIMKGDAVICLIRGSNLKFPIDVGPELFLGGEFLMVSAAMSDSGEDFRYQ